MKNTIIRDAVPTPGPLRPYPGKIWSWGMLVLTTYWIIMCAMTVKAYKEYNRTNELNKLSLVRYK